MVALNYGTFTEHESIQHSVFRCFISCSCLVTFHIDFVAVLQAIENEVKLKKETLSTKRNKPKRACRHSLEIAFAGDCETSAAWMMTGKRDDA